MWPEVQKYYSMLKQVFLVIIMLVSISVTAQSKREVLKINLPGDYKWKMTYNFEDSSKSFTQYLPESDEPANFTLACTIEVRKNIVMPDMELLIKSLSDVAIQESAKAKVTVIEKNTKEKNFWVIMKTETSDFPNDPKPESDLYYIYQGNQNVFVTYVSLREKQFSEAFLEKWIKAYKNSIVRYE